MKKKYLEAEQGRLSMPSRVRRRRKNRWLTCMWGMQEADHYAGVENTFMLINLGMNPWQDCLRGSAARSQNTVCLFACEKL